jgi:LysM repeat protein
MAITSAIRPKNYVLKNSTEKTVHPTGNTFDIGKKGMTRRCRVWLESRLLYLEDNNQVEATREKWPPHYHVVVFVKDIDEVIVRKIHEQIHIVQSGDTFYDIAKSYGISTKSLMDRNGLREGDIIHPGDKLNLPIR